MAKFDEIQRDGRDSSTAAPDRISLSPPSLCPKADILAAQDDEAWPACEATTGPAPRDTFRDAPSALLGGLAIAALDRHDAAAFMIGAARRHRRGHRPLYFTSANGEVIARIQWDGATARLFRDADQILADGQPLVFASRWLCRERLPERVATTDLFHDVARLAEREAVTFYLLGSTEDGNSRAAAVIRQRYPALILAGHCHGYLSGEALENKIDEINALAPDILWLGLGVPREQIFVRDFAERLSNVAIVKTAGGLFDHLAEKTRRAPLWMQQVGLEWFWRMLMEPRRLFWRYLTTNPRALYAILRHSR
jgi:exopolysaccharide biosynthesis WecB/TagA/CpsF family protein